VGLVRPHNLRVSRILALALAVPALLIVATGTAHAERWSAPDATGDVEGTHYDSDPTPCGTFTAVDGSADTNDDVTRLTVRHSRTDLEFLVGFRDLDEALEQSISFVIDTPRRGWELDIERFETKPGKFRIMADLSRRPKPPDPDELGECGTWGYITEAIRCGRPEFDFDADTVQMTLPRYCLASPRWVRVGVSASSFEDGTYQPDHMSFDMYDDHWGVAENGEEWLVFGPRVHAAPGAQKGAPSNLSRVTKSSTGLRRSFVSTVTGFPIGTTAATAY
jgi:hypothetical protein